MRRTTAIPKLDTSHTKKNKIKELEDQSERCRPPEKVTPQDLSITIKQETRKQESTMQAQTKIQMTYSPMPTKQPEKCIY